MARERTVIQFGEGGFLRGFADYSPQKAQDKGLFDSSVVIVQPAEKGMCNVLGRQGCEYNLFLRGIDSGQMVDEHTRIDIISRHVNPYNDFEAYVKLAGNPGFCLIVSNTAEAGIEYMDSNQLIDASVRSFPGELTQLLYKRHRLELKGLIILSYELIDHNGEGLEKCCFHYIKQWELEEEFETWSVQGNDFCSILVDHIVTRFPRDEHEELCWRIDKQDNTVNMVEISHL